MHPVASLLQLGGRRSGWTTAATARRVTGGRPTSGSSGIHSCDECLAPRLRAARDRGESNDLRVGESEIAGVREKKISCCGDGTGAASAGETCQHPEGRPSTATWGIAGLLRVDGCGSEGQEHPDCASGRMH